ncbi:glutamyl-tRNA synthetase [Terrimicrobium sacchariphilum]|uniref:Glutamate--tRNA ligase n=1 Tax=Terrimicrobium sacchariphilum TaxID=690879 RepID=A0A146G7N2_TERSA|nr:glutamate--tRNA ligase [Terrimicrobium sacchariphilum]GAT33709.1 glutamyl-tRNA synthetase [Terrimicrobium sacchariphilum]
MSVRTRFAPSPTGYLHVGGARTALFNWLYARRFGGTLVLRVEDTDDKRNTAEAVQAIYDGMTWLGLDWDEGPDKGGNYGPYRQSERNAIYEKYLAILEQGGYLYEDEGAIRFRSPRKSVLVEDLVCGRIEFDMSNPATHPDMTIRRPDGSWIFHFVNVVDDIEMKISHVIRGEDHLSNTPKHVELYKALGFEPPKFAHIPLILNHEGKKLSKRDGGSSVQYFIENGYAPEAVINYLCLLGWSPKDNREVISIEEVSQIFELENINRRNAIFDLDKCFWLNGQYIQNMPIERFAELSLPFIEKAGVNYGTKEALLPALAIVKPKVKHLSDVPDWIGFLFTEDFAFDPASVEKSLRKEGALERLKQLGEAFSTVTEWTHPNIEAKLKELAASLGVKVGELVHPARVAVSGRSVGPGLYEMMEVLGKDRVLSRFARAATI